MGQRIAKKEMQEGLELYHHQEHDAAVRKWKHALHRVRNRKYKFMILGYLASAHLDCGKYRDMLAYAVMQIDMANETDSTAMRAEAYWNLARSNEKLAEYHKAVSYSRHSLHNQPRDERLHGYVYICQANAYFGFSNFVKTLENLAKAMKVSKNCDDRSLELQVFACLGHVFACLKDYDKALCFHRKAAALAKSFNVCDTNWKYDRMAYLNLAVPFQHIGRFDEAMECCEDAMRLALADGDRPTQAKCLCCFGDIHRHRNDVQRALPRYEAAVNITTEIGDRYTQMEALYGLAKCTLMQKQLDKVTEYNSSALDLAEVIGNKMYMLRCRIMIANLARTRNDTETVEDQQCRCRHLQEDMELVCGVCGEIMGEKPEGLDTLPCCHLIHAKCTAKMKRKSFSKRGKNLLGCRSCCRRKEEPTQRVEQSINRTDNDEQNVDVTSS